MIKAWTTSVTAISDSASIVAAETRSKAKYAVYRSANDAGYGVKFSQIRAKRAPKYDAWAQNAPRQTCHTIEYVDRECITL